MENTKRNTEDFIVKHNRYYFIADNNLCIGQFQFAYGDGMQSKFIYGSELNRIKKDVCDCTEDEFIDIAKSYIYA